MSEDAIRTAVAPEPSIPLGQRLRSILEGPTRLENPAAECLRLARHVPPSNHVPARGVALGDNLSVWHAPWKGRAHTDGAWLFGPTFVRRLTWAPRIRQLGGTAIAEFLLDSPIPLGQPALAIAAFPAGQDVVLVRLKVPDSADQLASLLAQGAGNAPSLLADWLAAFKPFLGRAPEAKRVLLEAERLNRRPVVAGTEDPKQPAAENPFAVGVDYAVSLPDGGVFVRGWVRDPLDMLADLSVSSAFGTTESLSPCFYGDPARPGRRAFVGRTVSLRDPASGTQLRVTARLNGGNAIALVPPQPILTAGETRDLILRTVPLEALAGPVTTDLLESVLAPAIGALHAAHLSGDRVETSYCIGAVPDRPVWSIVVPLYRNLTFLRHQLAAFGLNPALNGAELVFVLDSPEQAQELDCLLRGLRMAFGVSMRVVIHARNLGFAAAINTGVAASAGERVLLLNSDVIPLAAAEPWLDRLGAHLDRDGVGAVGPKLLFDDDSLQHAGLYWERDDRGEWYNRHYYKGYPRDFAAACRSREVPAVTGACLALFRSTFDDVGGVTEDYVIGDYEDSDLCLKIREAGLTCRYAADVELYHMERQSITQHTGYERTPASFYNRRLHHGRWNAAIAAVQARLDAEEPVR